MACSSLIELLRSCGEEGIVAGLSKCYMISFADTKVLSTSLTQEIYALATNGMVNEIGISTGKKFVEIALAKDVSGLNSTMTKNAANGVLFHTTTFNMTLGGLSTENAAFVQSVQNQPVVVIVKTKTGKYFVAGLTGQMEVSELTSGTGAANEDLQGYTMTFTDVATKAMIQVDPTIIPDLLEAAV